MQKWLDKSLIFLLIFLGRQRAYILLEITVFYRNSGTVGAPEPEPVPVLAEHLDGDLLVFDMVVVAELVDGIGYFQVRIIAQGAIHISSERLLEMMHEMSGDSFLTCFRQVVAVQGMDRENLFRGKGIHRLARPEQGYPDAVRLTVGKYRPIV